MIFSTKHCRLTEIALLFCCVFVGFSCHAFAQKTEDSSVREVFSQTDPVKLFNQGQDAHSQGNFKKALKLYNLALRADPKLAEVEFQRGVVLSKMSNLTEAEKSFRKALSFKPEWTLPMISLASLLVRKNRFSEARKILNKVLISDAKNYRVYVLLTDLLLNTNASKTDLESLRGKLTDLTKNKIPPASIWVSKGAVERRLGYIKLARSSIQKVLRVKPKDQTAWAEIIEIDLVERKFKSAIENSKKILQMHPNSSSAKFLLSRAYNLSGNTPEALKVLNSVKHPNKRISEFRDALRISGNSIKDLESLLKANLKNPFLLGRLCVLSRLKNPQKALDYCKRALDLEKSNISHAIGYGSALVQLKQYPRAISILKSLLKLSPQNYVIRTNLATALFQMKRFEEARAQYRWIIKVIPDLAIGYYFLAISHDKLKEYKGAMFNYKRFLELASADENQLEIEKVNLRIPILKKQLKNEKNNKEK